MTRIPVHFNTVNDLLKFVNIVSRYNYDVELKSGDCVLDAKSIVSAIVLSPSIDLEMLVDTNDCQDLVANVSAYAWKPENGDKNNV